MGARVAARQLLSLLMVALIASAAAASDHADPPELLEDPAVDLADIYAFVGEFTDFGGEIGLVPNAVIVMTTVGAPELDVQYRMLFDTNPDNDDGGLSVDSQLSYWFTPNPSGEEGAPWCLNFELGALGVNSCLNPAWHDPETGNYDITVSLVDVLGAGEVRIFAGWRDDPFFFDQGAFQGALVGLATWSATNCTVEGVCQCPGGADDTSCYLDWTEWTGAAWGVTDLSQAIGVSERGDTFAGGRVYAFVVEAPSVALGATHIAAYAATYRRASLIRTVRGDIERGPWIQLDRMAVPGLSNGLIPEAQRLLFNRDSVDTSYAPTLTASVGQLRVLATRALLAFNHADRTSPTVAPTVEELLELIDPDVVRLDLTTEAIPTFPTFPNGRTLGFDVMDAVLSLVMGIPVTDGVDADDCEPLGEFPWLNEPGCDQ